MSNPPYILQHLPAIAQACFLHPVPQGSPQLVDDLRAAGISC